MFQFWPGNNHPITQFLAAQFDAGGQKIGPLFAFQRVFVIAGKFYLSRGPDPYLFWTVSHTINIAVWYEPRRSIFPFLVEKIWNLISNSFHCLAFYNGNYGCLSHFLQQTTKCHLVPAPNLRISHGLIWQCHWGLISGAAGLYNTFPQIAAISHTALIVGPILSKWVQSMKTISILLTECN